MRPDLYQAQMIQKPQFILLVRKLQPQESSLYRLIRLACLTNSPDQFGSTYAEEASTPVLKFETYIEQGSSSRFMFGAFDGGELIGIAGFDRKERQRDRHRGELVQVYVDADYRGQKVAERLLRGVIERAFSLDGLEQIQLSVVAGNGAAIRLYEKLGFKAYGWQPRYFKVGERYMDQQFMQLFKTEYRANADPH